MKRKGRVMRNPVWLAVLLVALSTPSFAQKAPPQQAVPQAVPVTTVIAQEKPVAQTKDFVGRIEAIERVEVRARVTGYLEAVLFKEGELVKEGQPLYRIEPDMFKAAVEQAEGALEGAKASKILTKVELDRAKELLQKSFGTPQKRDQAQAADENAVANIIKAQADLDTAKINLAYTDIRSPITGKISRTKVTKGNVVSPDSGVLTAIVSQDPMYVVFPVSRREFLTLRTQGNGKPADRESVAVTVRFSDGTVYGEKGRINFVDVSVDKATDTVTVRATLPNPDGVLMDSELVRVNVDRGKPQEQIVIPQAALIADQQGTYVFAVEDGKAVIRRVKTGGEVGANVAVASGLKAGEQVIVEGIQGVRPGAPVIASPTPEARS
jgi:membrane fusion protein, multidrug efflux system